MNKESMMYNKASHKSRSNLPKEVRSFTTDNKFSTKNPNVLNFVLDELPPKQIDRYYLNITGACNSNNTLKKNELSKALESFSLDDCLNVVEKMNIDDIRNQTVGSNKQKLQSIVTLYLTVAYLITKSIVKVNSYFNIAFSSLERDLSIIMPKNLKGNDSDELLLTDYYLKKDLKLYSAYKTKAKEIKSKYTNKKDLALKLELRKLERDSPRLHYSSCRYLNDIVSKNYNKVIENKLEPVIHIFRNKVVHLNVVTNMHKYISEANIISFYGLYCYSLQRLLIEEFEQVENKSGEATKFMNETKEKLLATKTFDKDFMWLLNVPFAYNLARYKNLSNEYIFYDYYSKDDKVIGKKPNIHYIN